MHAGNSLHAPAVAVCQTVPVHRLGTAEIGSAVLPDGNVVIGRQSAGHAGAPHQFVADVAVDDLVDFGELRQALVDVGVDAGDQLELGFAEIGGDVRVRERRPEPGRMRRRGELSVGSDAEAFFFDAAPYADEYLARKHA